MTIITILIRVKKRSFIIKKMIGLRAIFGIRQEVTIPIIFLKVSVADVRSVAEKDIASHFSV
ncbi:conserved hypothetical protein [Bacillus altitudinis]|nr:conserved hypothetical protein [Bacillus altitudinis]